MTISQHHDTILAMRAKGFTHKEIGEAIGLTERQVGQYVYRAGMPAKRLKGTWKGSIGRIRIRDLPRAQIVALEEYAEAHGLKTLAEAATEILKDALAEAQEAAE